jgi:pantetheine-phosphate adenylyltransferase
MNKTVLLASLKSFQTPHYLADSIRTAANATRKHLVIFLFFNKHAPTPWDHVQRLLTYVYVQATKTAQDKGSMLMNIDVLLKAFDQSCPDEISQDVDVVYRVSGGD